MLTQYPNQQCPVDHVDPCWLMVNYMGDGHQSMKSRDLTMGFTVGFAVYRHWVCIAIGRWMIIPYSFHVFTMAHRRGQGPKKVLGNDLTSCKGIYAEIERTLIVSGFGMTITMTIENHHHRLMAISDRSRHCLL